MPGIRFAYWILEAFSVRQDIIPQPARMVATLCEIVRVVAPADFFAGNRKKGTAHR